MAIALDATSGSSGSGTTLTFSHTCTGSNLILIVGVMNYDPAAITGVTYNGVAMTKIFASDVVSPSYNSMNQFYLVNPATGSNNIVVTVPGATPIRATGASYTGVAQTSPIDGFGSAIAGSLTPGAESANVTVTASNCWVNAMSTNDNNVAMTAGSGLTNLVASATPNQMRTYDSNGTVSTGTFVANVTYSGAAVGGWSILGTSFKPFAAAGPTNVKTFDGVTQSTGIKTYLGVALASTKTIDGIS